MLFCVAAEPFASHSAQGFQFILANFVIFPLLIVALIMDMVSSGF